MTDDACLYQNALRDHLFFSFYDNEESVPEPPLMPLPLTVPTSTTDFVPSTILIARAPFRDCHLCVPCILFDLGGPKSLFHRHSLPINAVPTPAADVSVLLTAAGTLNINDYINLCDVTLPEFTSSRHIINMRANLFDAPSPYDVIMGRDILKDVGIDTCFSDKTFPWLDCIIPMKPPHFLHSPFDDAISLAFLLDDSYETTTSTTYLLDSKYQQVTPEEVAQQQRHLTQ